MRQYYVRHNQEKIKVEIIDWLSIFGSIASIIGLILYILEKREITNLKIPFKYILILFLATVVLGTISLTRDSIKVEILQDKDNDDNQIDVKTN